MSTTTLPDRFDLTRDLLEVGRDALVVGGIGNATFDLFGAEDRDTNFYMMGSMGLAIPIALGLALAQPERSVVALEGDGSLLMNLGCLATVGQQAPENLTIVIWENAIWQLTGGQRLASAETCDLAAVAAACGISNVHRPRDRETFTSTVRHALDAPGPHVLCVPINPGPARASHHVDPIWLKHRFMRNLGIVPD